MEHLLNCAAANRVVAAGAEGEITDVYLRALVAASDGPGLTSAIRRILPATSSADEIRRLGRYALEMSLTDLVRASYAKLLALAPGDGEALRRLGNLDFVESRFAEAKSHLGRYLEQTGGDYESRFYFGVLLRQEGNGFKARVHYEEALAEIQKARPKTFHMRTMRALALHRLGKLEASVAAFDDLTREQPENTHLRADYATILIQAGRHDDARRLLGMP
jgi:Flp pilus assembly protein TadD